MKKITSKKALEKFAKMKEKKALIMDAIRNDKPLSELKERGVNLVLPKIS